MATAAPLKHPLPNFRSSRLIGIFNIVFATMLIMAGLGMGIYVVSLPFIASVMSQIQKQATEQFDRQRKSELAALDQKIKDATTPEAKIRAEVQREEVEKRPTAFPAAMMDLNAMGMGDPKLWTWGGVEVVTGLVLNFLLLFSGIGLLTWKPWARSLGVWTMLAKIVRLVVVYGYFVVGIVPGVAKSLGEAVVKMMTAQGNPIPSPGGVPPSQFFTQIYTITYSIMGVGFIVMGAVYPLIVIWFLTRPGVKSACSGVWALPREPKQPC